MGKEISKLSQKLCYKAKNYKALILGFEGSGKTSLFDRLKSNEVYLRNPTIGFNVDNIKISEYNITFWDFGGHEKVMNLWDRYFEATDLVILVIDSTNYENLESHKIIFEMLSSKLPNVEIIIVANKIDLRDSLTNEEIIKRIKLYDYHFKISGMVRVSTVLGDGIKALSKTIVNTLKKVSLQRN